ncbi:MAG: glycoside hydrolase [Nitrospirae bacterium]|nr:glycoside hydrolase [Nitrospirota bacterium]
MPDSPLQIAFLWHMHQPYYKDPCTGLYSLPWVRLHGVKDYLDMLLLLHDHPGLKQNFNLVPSLLMQLVDYTDNGAQDKHMQLTLKNPDELEEEDTAFIAENFFLANWETMIKPFPRYYELLAMRGFRYSKKDIQRITKYFRHEDIRDLQLLFNLAWIDPKFREDDQDLLDLVKKGRDYSEEDKHLVISKQLEILKKILPEYKSMWQADCIEVSFTPFYHPILPLLCDTDIAKTAMPSVKMPKKRFSYPEDAEYQIKSALEYSDMLFGRRPEGIWPSEGSVSDQVLDILRSNGIKWAATDEAVLANSLGACLRDSSGSLCDPAALYSNYSCRDVSLFFRDHKLSDQIGFVYSGWDAENAVNDMISRLREIKKSLPSGSKHIVPIILDGENAWEYYKNDGRDFLSLLYERLSSDPEFRSVTLSEFINENGSGRKLQNIFPGSWINSNFGIWIGHDEDNRSWDYLTQTREDLAAFEQANPRYDTTEARRHLYAAEGSDWNWWYGDEHSTETADIFDDLYRNSLIAVYKSLKLDPPAALHVPVLREDRDIKPAIGIRGFMYPDIDGIVTSYFEWHTAGNLNVKHSGGSMHRSESTFSKIYFGFNKENLFIRLDAYEPLSELIRQGDLCVNIMLLSGSAHKIACNLGSAGSIARLSKKESELWSDKTSGLKLAAEDIFEISIPFKDIETAVDDNVSISIEVTRNSCISERLPSRGHITVTVPVAHYEDLMWY